MPCGDKHNGRRLAFRVETGRGRADRRGDGIAAKQFDHRRIAGLNAPGIGGQHRSVDLDIAVRVGNAEQFGSCQHIGTQVWHLPWSHGRKSG